MKKTFIRVLVTAVLIIIGISAVYFSTNGRDGWNLDIFGKELEIDDTNNVVEQIRQISELTTMCYYQECVVKKYKMVPTFLDGVSRAMKLGGDSCRREIVVIAKGTIRAGFDLSGITDNDIRISSDTLYVSLPSTEIIDVISNPSDFEVYYEEGEWSHKEITRIQELAAEEIKKNAISDGILKKASDAGIKKFTSIFNTLGYRTVVVETKH